jgi:hypothetical protein
VEKDNVNTNYGTSKTLLVRGAPNHITESFLRFHLAGITGTVRSAKLRVRALSNGTVNGPAVHSAPSTWTETTIKWSNKPVYGTSVIADAGAIAANATVEYDVKPLVSGNGDVAFALVGTSDDGVDFAAREDGTASRRPQLVVTYGG